MKEGEKEKERQRGKKRRGGSPANVSSRHKRRKLPTSLFLIAEVRTIHTQRPLPPPPLLSSSSLPLCILWRLFICGGRCCGLQMLDPAVRLPGHMELQLFAWTCCFASKQTFKGQLQLFPLPLWSLLFILIQTFFLTWVRKCLHMLSGEEERGNVWTWLIYSQFVHFFHPQLRFQCIRRGRSLCECTDLWMDVCMQRKEIRRGEYSKSCSL